MYCIDSNFHQSNQQAKSTTHKFLFSFLHVLIFMSITVQKVLNMNNVKRKSKIKKKINEKSVQRIRAESVQMRIEHIYETFFISMCE